MIYWRHLQAFNITTGYIMQEETIEHTERKHDYDCAFYAAAIKKPADYDTLDDMATELFALRDLRASYSSWAREQDALMEKDFNAVEVELYNRMAAQGLTKIVGAQGTASRSTKVKPSVDKDSWPLVYDFMYEHRRGDMLHKRLTEKVVTELRDDGVIVPGINWAQSVSISLRSKGGVG
jgi:hypothetical protein